MKILAILPAALIAVAPVVSAQEVDPEFGVEPRPIEVARSNGVHPIARILFAPLMPFIEVQAALSPEKASCWNDGASEVTGCRIVTEIEEAQAARPTPYRF